MQGQLMDFPYEAFAYILEMGDLVLKKSQLFFLNFLILSGLILF